MTQEQYQTFRALLNDYQLAAQTYAEHSERLALLEWLSGTLPSPEETAVLDAAKAWATATIEEDRLCAERLEDSDLRWSIAEDIAQEAAEKLFEVALKLQMKGQK
jgi:hypothetical protein